MNDNMASIGQRIKTQLRVVFSYIADFWLLRVVANKRLDVFNSNHTILKTNKSPTHPLYIVLTSDDEFRMLKTLKKMIYLLNFVL